MIPNRKRLCGLLSLMRAPIHLKVCRVFDNTEVASIATLRYYRSQETLFSEFPRLDFLMIQMRRNAIPIELVRDTLGGTAVLDRLKEMTGLLDAEELKRAKQAFFNEFMANPNPAFRQFFGTTVVATQVRSDAAKAKSDRYENGSQQNFSKGCSGTVGGTSATFVKQMSDPAADAKLSIEIMGRTNNARVRVLTPPNPTQDYLTEVLTTILGNCQENTRAIVDTAGLCKSRDGTPESVVKKLWELLQQDPKIKGIKGIVYYGKYDGKDNVKLLYQGPNLDVIPCSTKMELAALSEKKYFSFYGQKNTRGSDIKQANGTHELVTIDENVTNSDAKQAVLRFRNLVSRDSGQTFSFAFMPKFESIVKEKLGLDAEAALGATDVANFLRLEEQRQEQIEAIGIFRKEMAAVVKQAAAHLEHHILAQLPETLTPQQREAYRAFLIARNGISAFVEKSVDHLFSKYGMPTTAQQRNGFILSQQQIAMDNLNKLFGAGRKFAVLFEKEITLPQQYYGIQIADSIALFEQRVGEAAQIQRLAGDCRRYGAGTSAGGGASCCSSASREPGAKTE